MTTTVFDSLSMTTTVYDYHCLCQSVYDNHCLWQSVYDYHCLWQSLYDYHCLWLPLSMTVCLWLPLSMTTTVYDSLSMTTTVCDSLSMTTTVYDYQSLTVCLCVWLPLSMTVWQSAYDNHCLFVIVRVIVGCCLNVVIEIFFLLYDMTFTSFNVCEKRIFAFDIFCLLYEQVWYVHIKHSCACTMPLLCVLYFSSLSVLRSTIIMMYYIYNVCAQWLAMQTHKYI